MRSFAPVLASAVLLTTLSATAVPAGAAGETCQGRPATLVGSARTFRLVGTEGPDVIVTNGSETVEALGGDDLVCVTVRGGSIFAGDGDDVVDGSTLTQLGVQARLGAGSDRFIGSRTFDVVWAGDYDNSNGVHTDTEVDVIDTGAAGKPYDDDSVYSGQRGATNGDQVRMGRGNLAWAGIPTAATAVDGGAGSTLTLRPAAEESISLDNVAGTLSVDTQPVLSFSGFTHFYLVAPQGPAAFSFRGSDRDEYVGLEFWEARTHTASMGGGDDRLLFYSYGAGTVPAGTSYDGGAGRDALDLTLPEEVDVDLDLRKGRLSTGPSSSEVTVPSRGFESSSVMARTVEIVGTTGRNELSTYACRSTVQGLGGRDELTTFDSVMDESLRCRSPRATFLGGGGNDVLKGSYGPDRLVGGPGRDTVDGSGDRDRCQGEKLRRCEVRR